jgi:hypothetical protein
MVWYIQNMPDNYAGAYIFRLGLPNMRYFTSPTGDTPAVEIQNPNVTNMARINLSQDRRDAFAIRFASNPAKDSYYADYVAGRTAAEPVPLATDGSSDLQVWDFTACPADTTDGWQMQHATSVCDKKGGLAMTSQSSDPQLISPLLSFRQDIGKASKGQFLRLRVSIRYPQGMPSDKFVSQWYWGTSAGSITETNQVTILINHTKNEQVYWTFIPVADLPPDKLTLRFDAINSTVSEQIHWIALDVVK